jgi:hypothetical protein
VKRPFFVLRKRAVSLPLLLSLIGPCVGFPAEPQDPEVLKGKTQLEEGNAVGAGETLERATERLERSAPKTRELALALYFWGVSQAVRGDTARARVLFRRGLESDPALEPPGPSFPRPVREAFEAAQRDRAKAGKASAGLKGALVGAGILTAGALVFAASGKRESPSTLGRVSDTYTGEIAPESAPQQFPVNVGTTGIVDARVDWIEPGVILTLELDDATHQALAVSIPTTTTEATLSVVAATGTAVLLLMRRDTTAAPANFTLVVEHP